MTDVSTYLDRLSLIPDWIEQEVDVTIYNKHILDETFRFLNEFGMFMAFKYKRHMEFELFTLKQLPKWL